LGAADLQEEAVKHAPRFTESDEDGGYERNPQRAERAIGTA
jgi:hypothetical protein